MVGYDGLSFVAMGLVVAIVARIVWAEWRGTQVAHS